MPGFIRRYGFFPGTEVITQIEGVVIIDLPPPGAVEGIATGVTAVVGEFADMTYATTVDGSGNVTTKIQPQEIFSSQDLLDKTGGFDETIGEFGNSDGNGFVALRNKRYSRLIVAPVNLASSKGTRYCRVLPLCTSATDPTPVVPVSGGVIAAGREFRSPTQGRARVAKRVTFTANAPIATGTTGRPFGNVFFDQSIFTTGGLIEQAWQFKDIGSVFVDETANANDNLANWTLFPTTSAANDYVAIGMAAQFSSVMFFTFFAVTGVGGVVAWEYWNGAAWTALTVSDGTNGFTSGNTVQMVTFTPPTDWATTTLNGVTKFYIRARVTTPYTTDPVYDSGAIGGTDFSSVVRSDGSLGVHKGDILVFGYNNAGSIAPASAGTYRVAADPASGATALVLEAMNGGAQPTFSETTATTPWRLHVGSDADSAPVIVFGNTLPGGYAIGDVGGYTIPTRPLTDASGANTDGTWAVNTLLAPLVAPPALTASTWDPLSGLFGRVAPVTGLVFTAAIQKPNAPAVAGIDALYTTSFDALAGEQAPISDINIVFAARTSSVIRAKNNTAANADSATAAGRMAVNRPDLHVVSTTVAVSDTDPGVGANRSERVIYTWPGAQTFIPEASGFRLSVADGSTVDTGVLDTGADGWLASVLSNLPPERNPGQGSEPVPTIMSPVLGLQRGVPNLQMNDYIVLRSRGVCALRIDRTAGPIFQSGVTTSLISGQKNISRRRMADFIEDSLARRLVQFTKEPLTTQNKDNAVAEVDAFLSELLSIDNAAAQRIKDYQVDEKSGNTPATEAQGIFVIIVRVVLIATGDFIVLQSEIGENVKILQAA